MSKIKGGANYRLGDFKNCELCGVVIRGVVLGYQSCVRAVCKDCEEKMS